MARQAQAFNTAPSALLGLPRTLDALALDEALSVWLDVRRMLAEAHATRHRNRKRKSPPK